MGQTYDDVMSDVNSAADYANTTQASLYERPSTWTAAGTSALSGLTAGSSFGPWGAVIGALVGAAVSIYGVNKQEQENSAARAESRGMRAQDQAISDRRYNIELGLKKKEMATQAAETAKKWKWEEENRNFQLVADTANRFMGLVQQQPAYQNQLLQIWGKQNEPVQMPVLRERVAA